SAAASGRPATPPLHLHHNGRFRCGVPLRRPAVRPRLRFISITTVDSAAAPRPSGHASASSPSQRSIPLRRPGRPATPPLHLHHPTVPVSRSRRAGGHNATMRWSRAVAVALLLAAGVAACSEDSSSSLPTPSKAFCRAAYDYDTNLPKLVGKIEQQTNL